jgi:hypothetical protein
VCKSKSLTAAWLILAVFPFSSRAFATWSVGTNEGVCFLLLERWFYLNPRKMFPAWGLLNREHPVLAITLCNRKHWPYLIRRLS